MRTDEEKLKAREDNRVKKVVTAEVIKDLQRRLKKSISIQKSNPGDDAVDQYQSGRQVELRYCIKLLITPLERYRYAKSKNQQNFLLRKSLSKVK